MPLRMKPTKPVTIELHLFWNMLVMKYGFGKLTKVNVDDPKEGKIAKFYDRNGNHIATWHNGQGWELLIDWSS